MPEASLEVVTRGAHDTQELAAAIAPLLELGDVVALSGELGAGKTCFVQGAVRGLGVEARVTSPTFVLVRQYEGRLPVVHCDVYRLDRLQDVHDLGDDVLSPEVVTFVEWADAVRPLLPVDRLEVELLLPALAASLAPPHPVASGVADEPHRSVSLRGHGPRWAHRAAALAAACEPWSDATSMSATDPDR